MALQLPRVVIDFVNAVNSRDLDAIMATISDDAYINDKHRIFRGRDAICRWAAVEMVGEEVTMEILQAVDHYGETVMTVRMGGGYNKARFDSFVVNSSITALHGVMPDVLLTFYFTLWNHGISLLIVTPIDGASPIRTDPRPFYEPYP